MPDDPPAQEEPKFKCKKCGKPYERGGKFLERHEDGCDGTPWSPDQKRTPRAAPSKPVPPSPFDSILKQARQEKDGILKEIKHHKEKREILTGHIERLTLHAGKLDQMIADMEKAKSD
jgi:hypothetical protein